MQHCCFDMWWLVAGDPTGCQESEPSAVQIQSQVLSRGYFRGTHSGNYPETFLFAGNKPNEAYIKFSMKNVCTNIVYFMSPPFYSHFLPGEGGHFEWWELLSSRDRCVTGILLCSSQIWWLQQRCTQAWVPYPRQTVASKVKWLITIYYSSCESDGWSASQCCSFPVGLSNLCNIFCASIKVNL